MTLRRLPRGPARRVLAYAAHARREVRWWAAQDGPTLVHGDRNVEPDRVGRWSPLWLTYHTRTRIRATRDATHGRRTIDWALSRAVLVTAIDTGGYHGSDHRLVVYKVRDIRSTRTLWVGGWNARHGRTASDVADRVARMFRIHGLDVLLLSEAHQYIRALQRLPGLRVVAVTEHDGQAKTCMVVAEGVPVSQVQSTRMTRRGWLRAGTRTETDPKWLLSAMVAGWCRLGVDHYPPSVRFPTRKAHS